jgi:hypothetical protein
MASRKRKGQRAGERARPRREAAARPPETPRAEAAPRGAPPVARPARRPGLLRRLRRGTDRWFSLVAVGLCLFGAYAAYRVARQAVALVQSDLPAFQIGVWWVILVVTALIAVLLVVQAIRSAWRFWTLRRGPETDTAP